MSEQPTGAITTDTEVTETQIVPIAGDFVSWSSKIKKNEKQPFEDVFKQGKNYYESLFQQGTKCLIDSNDAPPSFLPTANHAHWTADKAMTCTLYTSDAADHPPCVDHGRHRRTKQ